MWGGYPGTAGILRLAIARVTVDGERDQVHYKPEARPWFVT